MELIGIAVLAVAAWIAGTGLLKARMEGMEWNRRFAERHGQGARYLLGAIFGAGCVLVAVAVGSGSPGRALGTGILAFHLYRYVRHRRQGGRKRR